MVKFHFASATYSCKYIYNNKWQVDGMNAAVISCMKYILISVLRLVGATNKGIQDLHMGIYQ